MSLAARKLIFESPVPQNCFREKQKPGQRTDRVEYVRRLLSVEIEAIEIHHLVPGRDEVLHEGLLGIVTSIDFSDGAEL